MGFKMIYWTHMSGSYFFVWFYFGKMWKILEKRPYMAGLGKYHTGGYGQIGVYRVKDYLRNCIEIYGKTVIYEIKMILQILVDNET